MRILIIILGICFFAGTCINPPNYSVVPKIKFKSLNITEVIPGIDTLLVTFEYEDGDGDIGVKDGDTSTNTWLVDRRTQFPYVYQLPFVNQKGNSNSISGTIWITVSPFTMNCRPDHPILDTISYDIYIKDRDGNISNTITTPDIVLKCQ